jgi:hypothetical protein
MNGMNEYDMDKMGWWNAATYLTKVEIDEVFCFVRHVTTKITSNNTVPSWVVLFVEFLFQHTKQMTTVHSVVVTVTDALLLLPS